MSAPSSVVTPAFAASFRGRVRVGGRVLAVAPRAIVADATGQLPVVGLPDTVAVGDLVVVAGTVEGGVLTAATLEHHGAAPEPRGDGDVGRFLLGGVGAHLVARARLVTALRRVLDDDGFVEVDTPVRLKTPGLDVHVGAIPAHGGHLSTSPEFQMKRLLVGGVPRLYQLQRCSRDDPSGPHHEPEFLMLEWYRAFAGVDAVMADTEALVRAGATALGVTAPVTVAGHPVDLNARFERVTVRDAFRRHAAVDDAVALARADEDRFFQLLVDVVEPALTTRPVPVFLHEFPASQASLARRCPHDDTVAERFELYLGGVELCNGFGELTDPAEQRRRFETDQAERRRRGLPVYSLDEQFLGALAEGMPPAGGNALGVDRLLLILLGAPRLQDVTAFPWDLL